jgi:hypothetical protein
MRLTLLGLAAVLALAGPARAQYEWRAFADDINQVALYHEGRQIGAYHLVKDYYRPLDPATLEWGQRCPPPIAPPRRNFGLIQDKIREGDHYRLNGREVSKEQIQQALGDAEGRQVPDDSRKLRITIIGDPNYRSAVAADLARHPALAPWKDRIVAVGYAPDHWAITRQGFHATGQPTIYIQGPDGAVLHRQDDYQGGAAALAEVLRKLDPNYKPANDRDRRKVDLSGWLLPRIPWSVPAVLFGAVVLFVFLRRKP